MTIATVINSYRQSKKENRFVKYEKIKATENWVRYSLDILELKQALRTCNDFSLKRDILQTLEIAEKKAAYHYKHPNFEISKASKWFTEAKRLLAL
jgi:hypothetical protein